MSSCQDASRSTQSTWDQDASRSTRSDAPWNYVKILSIQIVEILPVDWCHLSRCLQFHPREIWCPWKLGKDPIYSNWWNVTSWLMSSVKMPLDSPEGDLMPLKTREECNIFKLLNCHQSTDINCKNASRGSNLFKLYKCDWFFYVILFGPLSSVNISHCYVNMLFNITFTKINIFNWSITLLPNN